MPGGRPDRASRRSSAPVPASSREGNPCWSILVVAMSTIRHDDVGEDLRRIVISGRLDTPGTGLVGPRLAELTATPRKALVVDLSAVSFLASTGMGALIVGAKTVKNRG